MRVPASDIGLTGQESREGHMAITHEAHLGYEGAGHSRTVALIATGWQAEGIYTLARSVALPLSAL